MSENPPQQCLLGRAVWDYSAPQLPRTGTWRSHEARSAEKHHLKDGHSTREGGKTKLTQLIHHSNL